MTASLWVQVVSLVSWYHYAMEEMFDILNEDSTSAGYSLPRSQVHREGQWHRSVHVWVADHWDRLLLQQRAFDKDSNPGLWDISTAGHLSAGQNALEAGVRELSEEVGLVVAPERLQFLFEDKDQALLRGGTFIDREFHSIYFLRLEEGEAALIKPDPGELAGVRWIAPESLREELQRSPHCFVQHDHEYPRILAHMGVG